MQEQSKDNSGEKIYIRKRDVKTRFALAPHHTQSEMTLCEPQIEYVSSPKKLDEFMLDRHGHLIVKHDLFNHDGLTHDGIAEAFAEFAKKERLSFF
jgi:type I restriction enzyme M protein